MQPGKSVCRLADLSQFLNEAEVLAFYLDHLNEIGFGTDTCDLMSKLPLMGLTEFKCQLAALDRAFLDRMRSIRSGPAYRLGILEIDLPRGRSDFGHWIPSCSPLCA